MAQVTAQPVEASESRSSKSAAEHIAAIRGLATGASESPVEDKVVETPAPEVSKQDMNGKVVLLIPDADVSARLVKDVLIQLEISDDDMHLESEGELNKFANYSMAWIYGDEISISDNVLTTPAVNVLQTPHSKQKLWQALSSI